MLLVENIICLVLLTCFDKELTRDVDCPDNCKCYSAPKDGYDWSVESRSLICNNVNDISLMKLKEQEPINTLAISSETIIDSSVEKQLPRLSLSVSYLYLYSTIGKTSSNLSLPLLNGMNVQTLEVLALNSLNIEEYYWTDIIQFKLLKAIYIKDSVLKTVLSHDFGRLNNLGITSLSIINSELEEIGPSTFQDWNELKLLTIVGNKITNLNWARYKFPKLWFLNLKNNYIETIPERFFDDQRFPRLSVLNLDDNNLKILSWDLIEPALPILKEFSFQSTNDKTNVLCPSKDVEHMYDNFNLLLSPIDLPAFFSVSMHNLPCKNFSHEHGSNFECRHVKKLFTGQTYSDSNKCNEWTGGKNDFY